MGSYKWVIEFLLKVLQGFIGFYRVQLSYKWVGSYQYNST